MVHLLLSQREIPRAVLDLLAEKGVEQLYPPQAQAIEAGVLEGKNAVLAFPTASGKTLVAELVMLKHILESGGKALYLVPLKALASEKFDEFKKWEKLGAKIALSTGEYDSSDRWLGEYDIVISTNEKTDSLLRHQAEWLARVTVVVADEVHLLNEAERGPTLEVALARLRQVNPKAQLLALSATIKNAYEIAEWLGATPIVSDWRPVPLKEGVFFNNQIKFGDGSTAPCPLAKGTAIIDLTIDTVGKGGQALIFTNARRAAVSTATHLAGPLSQLLKKEEKYSLGELADSILSSSEVTRISQRLAELARHGVAFHHAGLHYTHRRIVEDAFRSNLLKAVCSTPTLAAGVNLPARRVILSDHRRFEVGLGLYPIGVLEYKQMAGRAGRPEYDTYGEALLIAHYEHEVEDLFESYVKGQPERIWSKLASEKALRTHVLAIIASRYAKTSDELERFFQATFYGHQYGAHTLRPTLANTMDFLTNEDFIRRRGNKLFPTPFGQRTSELYIDPVSAILIKKTLGSEKGSTFPLPYLHLVALCPDMPKLYIRRGEREKLVARLTEDEHELFIRPPEEEDEIEFEDYLASLKVAYLLSEWIEEQPEDVLVRSFDVGSGDIYSLTESGEWLINATYELARLFELKVHLSPLSALSTRIHHGVKAELLPLVELRGIGRVRARNLFNAGYRSSGDLSKARFSQLISVPSIGAEVAKSLMGQLGVTMSRDEEELASHIEKVKQHKLREFT